MSADSRDPHLPPPPEPSVLDYILSRLSFGRRPPVEIPESETTERVAELEPTEAGGANPPPGAGAGFWASIPWRSLCALVSALAAQTLFEPPSPSATGGTIGYALAFLFLVWAVERREWMLPTPLAGQLRRDPLSYRCIAFLISLPLGLGAFLALTENLFTLPNVSLWVGATSLFIWSLWLRDPERPSLWQRVASLVRAPSWEIRIDRWSLLMLAAACLVMFFRLYNLQHTPAEPFSDHAEKLLDVYDVSQGQTHIFFPRNTGREAIQMYWTLLMSWIFGTGLSFISLKIGTALIGLLTLPYVYLLGKELGGKRVGLLAVVLTGIAYWPNVISRVGLRFPLYPAFVAPLMLYLIRGLRDRNRNDFILAGLFLGLGLHGYSPFRIVPLLVIVAFALYLMHAQSRGSRQVAMLWFAVVALVSLSVFLPLLRYATQNPGSFSYRALTRLEGIEQPLGAPWYQVFLSNTWNALKMFNWNNGSIWVHSVPDRPALDVVMGALFLIGVVLLVARYLRTRQWLDLFLLMSIPVLLLPSILSLAFPDENPSLNRTAGALIPAFIIAALALDGFISVWTAHDRRAWLGYALTVALIWSSASQNYDLVFHQYDQEFRESSWNSSEMGAVIKLFGQLYGETDTVWVIPFPHWVDTRLVGVWAGIPNRDFGKWAEELPETLQFAAPKLFMAKANTENPALNDQNAIEALRRLYPQGSLSLHHSPVPGHDFWIYFVPAQTMP